MQASEQLRRFGHHIDGASVPPGSREYLPTEEPDTGRAWALIARDSAVDANAAVWMSTDLEVPNPFVRR